MVWKPFFDFLNLYSGDIHMSSPLHQLLYLSIIEGISWWDYHDHGRTRMKQQQWVTSIEFGQFQSWRSMQDSIRAWVDVGGIFLGRTAEVYVERKVIVHSCSETTMMKWMELNSGWSQSRGALTLVGPNSNPVVEDEVTLWHLWCKSMEASCKPYSLHIFRGRTTVWPSTMGVHHPMIKWFGFTPRCFGVRFVIPQHFTIGEM